MWTAWRSMPPCWKNSSFPSSFRWVAVRQHAAGPYLARQLSAFRDRGVPGPTSECRRVPQPRWVGARPSAKGGNEAAGDRRERGGNPAAFVFVPRPGRVRLFVCSSLCATLPQEGPGPPFYRCKERVQVYNGGCSYALTCLAERCLSPVYMPTWLSEKCLSPAYAITWPSEKCLSPVEAQLAVRLGSC